MYQVLLVLHFIALAMAMGGGFANIVSRRQMTKAEPVTYPGFALASGAVGKMATLGLLLLWITGIWMAIIRFGSFGATPPMLWVKIAVVTLLTGFSASLNIMVIKAKNAGAPPDEKKLKAHAHSIAMLGVFVVILAVLIFS